MDTALVVIGVQESFRHTPHWQAWRGPAFFATLNQLIEGAEQKNIPIVRIFHVAREGPFALGTGWVTSMPEARVYQPAAEFYKSRHSALVGTDLQVWLIERRIRRLIVCGIRTEQDCETTARHAADLGFLVDYVTEATLTFDMMHRLGVYVPALDIQLKTELVLTDRFATICTVDEALARASAVGA